MPYSCDGLEVLLCQLYLRSMHGRIHSMRISSFLQIYSVENCLLNFNAHKYSPLILVVIRTGGLFSHVLISIWEVYWFWIINCSFLPGISVCLWKSVCHWYLPGSINVFQLSWLISSYINHSNDLDCAVFFINPEINVIVFDSVSVDFLIMPWLIRCERDPARQIC